METPMKKTRNQKELYSHTWNGILQDAWG